MPEPLLQLILGTLSTTIVALAGYIVRSWAVQIAELKADRNFWRDRSLAGQERVDKALDTLADAISMIRERPARGGGDR